MKRSENKVKRTESERKASRGAALDEASALQQASTPPASQGLSGSLWAETVPWPRMLRISTPSSHRCYTFQLMFNVLHKDLLVTLQGRSRYPGDDWDIPPLPGALAKVPSGAKSKVKRSESESEASRSAAVDAAGALHLARCNKLDTSNKPSLAPGLGPHGPLGQLV